MTDRQLKYLITLADEGNMTSAAQKLFISQPSLSSLLSHIEKELGTELFNRNTSPLTLTDAGKIYINAAHKILGIKREAENYISDVSNSNKSTLHIGCGSQLSSILYPRILPEFMHHNSAVKLKLVEDHFTPLRTQLLCGELDLVVSNRIIDDRSIENTLLYREELCVVTPVVYQPEVTHDNCHSFPVINPEEINRLSFILVKKGQTLRQNIDEIFNRYSITPNILLETSNWETCYRMVEQNMGCTIVPYSHLFTAALSAEVKRFSLPGSHFRDVRIFWPRQSRKFPALNNFVKLCYEKLSDHPTRNTW